MSTDCSAPFVRIEDLYRLSLHGRMAELHDALSQLPTERLENLRLRISKTLDHIRDDDRGPWIRVIYVGSDVLRDRAVSELLGGAA